MDAHFREGGTQLLAFQDNIACQLALHPQVKGIEIGVVTQGIAR